MKISVEWLKNYVTFSLPPEKLAHRLTLAGHEVEHIEDVDGDAVMDLEVTPNRPDCLNMWGMAREIAAVLNRPLRFPKIRKATAVQSKCAIDILDREGCPRYIGTVVKGVRVGPSPEWLKRRLLSIGLRPINNIVDITNFVLMETGQPLHAFDYDRLEGQKIIVRRARKGEAIRTLDGQDRQLSDNILVIADARQPVAIAGIMGGERTEVTERTQNILLESAYFDSVLVRRGGRALGLSSEASYRFERGVDMERVDLAADRAIMLIRELAGGNVCQRNDVSLPRARKVRKEIVVSRSQTEAILGSPVPMKKMRLILKKLDFKIKAQGLDRISVIPPSFRQDVNRAEDIYEEVARIIGYDQLDASIPRISLSGLSVNQSRIIKEKIRQRLIGQGYSEIVTYTLTNRAVLEKTLLADRPALPVKNPLTQEQELMRPAILPSFLSVVLLNLNRGQRDLKFFEIAKTYSPDGKERERLGLILTGETAQDWRALPQKETISFYDIKGTLAQAFGAFDLKDLSWTSIDDKIFSSGEAAALKIGQQEIGRLGKLSRDILLRWDIKHTDVLFAEMDLEFLYQQKHVSRDYHPIPAFPAVTRDISLAVKKDVSYDQIRRLLTETGGELLTAINFSELYLGDKIPAGHRGYVFSLTYQSASRTLTEEEVKKIHNDVLSALTQRLGAMIR